MDTRVFNLAQSFFVDPDSVKGAKTVGISSVDLFFKSKPSADGNKSGISNPGVFVFVCEVSPDKQPNLGPYIQGFSTPVARVAYADVNVSPDATRSTKFKFKSPVFVNTGKEYAFVVVYEGNESFDVWTSKQGDLLLGTNKVSPGPSGKYVGNFYSTYYVNPTTSSVVDAQTSSNVGINSVWKPLSDTDLKFNVNIARYAVNGVLVDSYVDANTFAANVEVFGTVTNTLSGSVNTSYSGSTLTYQVAAVPHEYVVYDNKLSKTAKVKAGELVYQNTVFYPGGTPAPVTVSMTQGSELITANTLLPNGSSFNWNNIYGAGSDVEYIVLISQDDPSSGKRRTEIKKISSVESNTVLRVDSPVAFTNNAAYFMKSPVAKIDSLTKTKSFDHFATTVAGRKKRVKQDMLILSHSNANSTVRFANDTINSIAISVAGGNYKSSDYISIFGYEDNAKVKGGYPAVANITVNGSGNVTGIYLTNVGAGFVNTANLTYVFSNGTATSITAASSNTANGSGATFTVTTGATLRAKDGGTDTTGGYFTNSKIVNIEFLDIIPAVKFNYTAGSQSQNYYKNPYYIVNASDTFLGSAYYIASDAEASKKMIREMVSNRLDYKNIPVMPSRSNEFVITDDVTNNVKSPETLTPGSGVFEFNTTSNNDFVPTFPDSVSMIFGKYVINNDYSGENTDYGNADSKHITSKISFATDRFAEDLVVYLTAYRPLNTDIKVFARVHNSNDTEAFDDKDWSLLQLDSGDIYSSSADPNDYIEMQFGFTDSPNTAVVLAGTATVDNVTTTNVTGFGTTFSSNATANLQVNDLVKIYSPLFPNSYSISVVSAVDSDTQFKITEPINDVNVTGSGLIVDLLGRVGNSTFAGVGYPQQAFNNINNSGIVRYYTSSMTPIDTYNTLQIKIVMLSDIAQVSNNSANAIPTTIPRVDDIRVVGVTV